MNIQQGNGPQSPDNVLPDFGVCIYKTDAVDSLYLWKTCKIPNGADMGFIPKYGHPPPYWDVIHEKPTVLPQIIWMENYLFLTWWRETEVDDED